MIWGITSALLMLMDVCYSLVQNIVLLNFMEYDLVWQIWGVLMFALAAFVVIRIFLMWINVAFSAEKLLKFNLFDVYIKVLVIGVVVAMTPFVIRGVADVGTTLTSNVNVFVGGDYKTKPSTILITSTVNVDNGEWNDDGEWIEKNVVSYSMGDIDINTKDPTGNNKYKFFNGLGDIFVMMFVGIAAAIMLILTTLQIGKRAYEVVMLLLVSPIPISSIVNPESDTFKVWAKGIVSIYLTNFFQLLTLIMVMVLSSSRFVKNAGMWTTIIMILAGFLTALAGVPQLARILGADTSGGGALQQMASLRMATGGIGRGLGNTAKKIGGAVGGAAKNLKDKAVHGVGKSMGGVSMDDFNAMASPGGISNIGSSMPNQKGANSPFNRQPSIPDIETKQTPTTKQKNLADNVSNMKESQVGQVGLSYAGSKAASYATKAMGMTGVQGAVARRVVQGASHSYMKSMQRIQQSSSYQKKTAKKQMRPSDDITRIKK